MLIPLIVETIIVDTLFIYLLLTYLVEKDKLSHGEYGMDFMSYLNMYSPIFIIMYAVGIIIDIIEVITGFSLQYHFF